jgi:RNA polymerase sigma-70 factor (ECF subfamily)
MSEPLSALSGLPIPFEDSAAEQGWIARVRHGDSLAFKAIYDRYSDAMFAFAYSSLKSREEAEDVVHDIFFNILKSRESWNVTGELRAYLMRSVYNRVATLRRHLRVELASHETLVREAGSPEEWAYRGSTDAPLLEQELGQALVREQSLTHAAAASVMGISTHTVEIHLIRALRALRDQLASWRR